MAQTKLPSTQLATITCKAPFVMTNRNAPAGIMFPETGATGADFQMVVPDNYVSGDITVKVLYRPATAGGVVHIQHWAYRFRDNAAVVTIHNSVGNDYTTASTVTRVFSFTIAASNFQAGDVLRVDLRRNQADSSTNGVELDGIWAEYTGTV